MSTILLAGLCCVGLGVPNAAVGQSQNRPLLLVPIKADWAKGLASELARLGAEPQLAAVPDGLAGGGWRAAMSLVAGWRAQEGTDARPWIIIALGDGDARDLTTDEGAVAEWGTSAWRIEYQRRVDDVIQAIPPQARCFWLGPFGHPHPNTHLRAAVVSTALAQAARGSGCLYLDGFSATTDRFGRPHVNFYFDPPSAPPARTKSGAFTKAGLGRLAQWLMVLAGGSFAS